MSPDWWRDCRDGIEKCSSPTGDGNKNPDLVIFITIIEKCSSPTGDGNQPYEICALFLMRIEKCSSPTGDGNSFISYIQVFNVN